MVVFDFDGVMVESSRTEKLWRRLAEKMNIKTPKILFFLKEIIDFFFKKPKLKKEIIETIEKINKNCCLLGILTDRSHWSLWSICASDNTLNFSDFDFIQTRESILDFFIEKSCFPLNFKSKKTKEYFEVFQNLKKFAAENNVNTEEILIIEDSKNIIKLAKNSGFSVLHIKHINYLRCI